MAGKIDTIDASAPTILENVLSSPVGIITAVLLVYAAFKLLKIDGPIADALKLGREFMGLAKGIKSLESLNAFVLALAAVFSLVGLLSASVFRVLFTGLEGGSDMLPDKYDVLGGGIAIAIVGILCVRSVGR